MTDAPHGATLSFEFEGERRARIVERSLAQDVGEIDDDRSRTTVSREGATLTLRIAAADPVALRAALNTWCSLSEVAERMATAGGVE